MTEFVKEVPPVAEQGWVSRFLAELKAEGSGDWVVLSREVNVSKAGGMRQHYPEFEFTTRSAGAKKKNVGTIYVRWRKPEGDG